MKTAIRQFSENKNSLRLLVAGVVVILLAIFVTVWLGSGQGAKLRGAAGADQLCPSANTDPQFGTVISTDGVMVRVGPNVNYENVDPDNPALPYCAAFELLGRNADSTWLYVSGDSLTGWIFYDISLEKIDMNVNELPALNSTTPQQVSEDIPEGFHVTIENNAARVTITDLPASQAFYVRLRPDGQPQKEINFYQGIADNHGRAEFQQTMPFIWEDGSRVEYGRLVMEAFVAKTKAPAGSAVILYGR